MDTEESGNYSSHNHTYETKWYDTNTEFVPSRKQFEAREDLEANGHFDSKTRQVKTVELGTVGRLWTLSIAVPGSLLTNAASLEMKTYVIGIVTYLKAKFSFTLLSIFSILIWKIGQVARAAAIFCVDEIVVYDDGARENQIGIPYHLNPRNTEAHVTLMARILSYLECPPYLRSYFFPAHPELKYVGLLNPIATTHHLQQGTKCVYREGVVVPKERRETRHKRFIRASHAYVHIGLRKNVLVYGEELEENKRVTVKLRTLEDDTEEEQEGDSVSPHEPRTNHGLYWGYDVRTASNFNSVFSQSSYDGGYDLIVGVGSKGQPAEQIQLGTFKHALLVFHGVRSLERLLQDDDKLEVKDPVDFFNAYVNPIPTLDTGYVRAEESLLVSLSMLKPKFDAAGITAPTQDQ